MDLMMQIDRKNYPSDPNHDGKEEQKQQVDISFGIKSAEINCNSLDIDLATIEKSNWASRAIKEALNNGKIIPSNG